MLPLCRSHLSDSFVGDIFQLPSLFADDDSDDELVGVSWNRVSHKLSSSTYLDAGSAV